MGICFFVFAPQLAAITNPDHQALAKSYLRVFAVFVPLAAIEQVSLAATRGLGSMRTNAIVEQLGRPTLQVALVAGALAVPTATNLGWAWSLPYAPAALFAWLLWRRARDAMVLESAPPGVSVGREFWRFSAPRSLASVAQLAMQRFDIVLVAAIAGASEAAVYTVATRFVVAGQMARNAVSLALQPPIAQALARPESPRALALFQMSTAWLMIVTWPIYLLLAVFSGPLMQVFGHGYQEGALVLTLVALSLVISTACGDVGVVLIMAARTSWSLGVVLVGFGVNLGLDLWLIPGHGVLGAAIGWSVAIVVKNVVALGLVRGSLKLQPVARPFLIVAGLSLVWFAVVPVVVRVVLGSTWTGLVTSLVIGGAGFLFGVWSARRPLQLESLRRLR
jgi:O-antigen/teichoic acid export membrane protein